MAKKRKAAPKKRVTRKPPAGRRPAKNPDATVNALVILVVIAMVLGGLYLYAQNKKQAALLSTLRSMVANYVTFSPAPAAGTDVPVVGSIAQPLAPADAARSAENSQSLATADTK